MDKVRPARPKGGRKIAIAGVTVGAVLVIASYFYFNSSSTSLYRPQEPTEPYPYRVEDVTFQNESANITLSGTMTIPVDTQHRAHSAVILISGYGPQNRDAEWFGHKPFLILADHLTRQGIVVLRFDDRGVGKSTGNYPSSTSLDFSTDVESAFNFLKTRKEIDTTQIGLIGHSDGAMVAPMVAARRPDVRFIVLLAGPGILGRELMIKRQELWERKAGKSENEIRKSTEHMNRVIDIVVNSNDQQSLFAALTNFANETKDEIPNDQVPPGMTKEEFISRRIEMLTSPWFKYFFTYDPKIDLSKVKCPVLAITGDKDVQSPPTENLQAIKSALVTGGNKDVTIKELKGLNHMFQECKTGTIDEYATIDQTFSPTALKEISQFILNKSNSPEN